MRWTEQDYSPLESNRITWGRDKDSIKIAITADVNVIKNGYEV